MFGHFTTLSMKGLNGFFKQFKRNLNKSARKVFVYHSKKSIFDVIQKYMLFNKLFDIPSFIDITLSLFQALFFTGRRWCDGWLMSQRLGKSRIASMKVSLSKRSTFHVLVAFFFKKKTIIGIYKIFTSELKNQTNI